MTRKRSLTDIHLDVKNTCNEFSSNLRCATWPHQACSTSRGLAIILAGRHVFFTIWFFLIFFPPRRMVQHATIREVQFNDFLSLFIFGIGWGVLMKMCLFYGTFEWNVRLSTRRWILNGGLTVKKRQVDSCHLEFMFFFQFFVGGYTEWTQYAREQARLMPCLKGKKNMGKVDIH